VKNISQNSKPAHSWLRFSFRRVGLRSYGLLLAGFMAFYQVGVGQAQPLFRVTDLTHILGPTAGHGNLTAINDHGQIAGVRWDPASEVYELVRYSLANGLEHLGAFESATPHAVAINNKGWIAGSASFKDGTIRGFLYRDGVGTEDLGLLGDSETGVHDMSNHGEVVGTKYLPWSPEYEASFRYTSDGGMRLVGELTPGLGSRAYAVNDRGEIVGRAFKVEKVGEDEQKLFVRGFRYVPGEGIRNLGTTPGARDSVAYDINNQGTIVGTVRFVAGRGEEVVLWSGDEIRSIGSLGGPSVLNAHLNDLNHVAGNADTRDRRIVPFYWTEETGMQRLSDLVDPETDYSLIRVFDINNADQMVAMASLNGEIRWVRLDLVPEPSTWALAGLGLALLSGNRAFRQKRSDGSSRGCTTGSAG